MIVWNLFIFIIFDSNHIFLIVVFVSSKSCRRFQLNLLIFKNLIIYDCVNFLVLFIMLQSFNRIININSLFSWFILDYSYLLLSYFWHHFSVWLGFTFYNFYGVGFSSWGGGRWCWTWFSGFNIWLLFLILMNFLFVEVHFWTILNHRTIPDRLRSNFSLWFWDNGLSMAISSVRRLFLFLSRIHWRINFFYTLMHTSSMSCRIQSRISFRPLSSKTLNHWILSTFHLNWIWKGHICFTSIIILGISSFLHLIFKFVVILSKATSWIHVLWVLWCLIFLFNTWLRSSSHWIPLHFINSTLLSSKNYISVRKNILYIV